MTPRIPKDDRYNQKGILLALHEKIGSSISSSLHRMPTGKRKTPTYSRVTATTTHSRMEMGSNQHGFHNMFTYKF